MTVRNLSGSELEKFKVENGILITEVKPYSNAYDQGLSRGWIIVKADRNEVKNVAELKSAFESKKGKAVLLEVSDGQGNSRFVGIEIPM
jgi:S1-C subfamily serine protease